MQGGQFMRAVVQRCQHMGPRMHTLVTLGAQHQGVMAAPGCLDGGGTNTTLLCRMMQARWSQPLCSADKRLCLATGTSRVAAHVAALRDGIMSLQWLL
jgi:hypothetical protein